MSLIRSMSVNGVREVCLGAVEAIPPGEGRSFRVNGEVIAVFRERSGKLHAVENRCPHAGGPLAEGISGGCTVICPMHAWKFDLESGACLNDPSYTLRTFPIREEGGALLIAV